MKKQINHVVKLVFLLLLSIWVATDATGQRYDYRSTREPSTFYSKDSTYYLALSLNKTSFSFEEPLGRFYCRNSEGTDSLLWENALIYSKKSDSVLVAGDGHHIVTFQTRVSGGYGDNVVVLYGDQGQPIRKYGLSEICPYRADVKPRSGFWAFDLWDENYWGSGHRIDDVRHQLVLRMIPNCERYRLPDEKHVEVRIDLKTGDVITPLNHPKGNQNAPDTLWIHKYDFPMHELYSCGAATAISGGFFYIISGIDNRYKTNEKTTILLRVSSEGDTLWSTRLNTSGNKIAIASTCDKGVVIGTSYSRENKKIPSGDRTYFRVEKLNYEGQILWTNEEETTDVGETACATSTRDNGIVIASTVLNSQRNALQLRKYNSNGLDVWIHRYPCEYEASVTGITELENGDLFIIGNREYALFRVTAEGDSLWSKQRVQGGIGGGIADQAGGAIFNPGGHVFRRLIGRDSLSDHIELSTLKDAVLKQYYQTSDGGWIMSGTIPAAFSHDMDFVLVRCDSNLQTLWSFTLGSPWNDFSPIAQQTSDGGYLVCGVANKQVWVFKVAPE